MATRLLLPRALLAMSATIFALGGLLHARAFFLHARPLLESKLAPFDAAELQVLWLADSSTLLGLAAILGFLVAKPRSAKGATIMLLSLVPAGTTLLLYVFLGPFYAGHMLALGTLAMLVAGGALGTNGGINA